MQREVMIKKQLRDGNNQLVKATVLSEHNGKLRCTQAGIGGVKKAFEVDTKDVVEASTVFSGNRLAQQRGVVVTKQYGDTRNSLSGMLAAKHVPPPKKSSDSMKPSDLIHEKGVTLETGGDEDEMEAGTTCEDTKEAPAATNKFNVGQTVRHKKSGWVGKVSQVHPTKSPNHKLLRVQYQSKNDTQPMLVNHHSSELEPAEGEVQQ